MERSRAAVLICAIMGICIITVAAVATGHDSVLVTAATAAIVGVGTGAGFYYKGRQEGDKAVQRMMLTLGSHQGAEKPSDGGGRPPTKA